MNNLCADVGYKSITHEGEELCGDHVEVVRNHNSSVVVLADGMGSGVKASILSTLTARIISTMIAKGMGLEECVSTITATLPECSVRHIAYSTFNIIHIIDNATAEIIQYDSPDAIFIRDGKLENYSTVELTVNGKKIRKAVIPLKENDIFIIVSDGCVNSGPDNKYNLNWQLSDISNYMLKMSKADYTAKTLATILVDECNRLYEKKPTDDATACVVRICGRRVVNVLFGPPANRDDCGRMMSLFFSKGGKHIVCGGTTSVIAAKWLNKSIKTDMTAEYTDVPPIAHIAGVDLVTEGTITMSKVLKYAKDYVKDNENYYDWGFDQDGASQICKFLFEEATDINFFVGKAVNPAHQNPNLPVNFSLKMNLVQELTETLTAMGKTVKSLYF